MTLALVPKKIRDHYFLGKLKSWFMPFKFQGKKYNYICRRYNATWRNERAVEIPIVWQEVQKYNPKKVLELGNVLSHYFKVSHDIVDKYETAPGVINKDIVGFSPKKKYDLIVGISTLEHVGWDEKPKSKTKTLAAVKHMTTLLKKNGLLLLTIPVGHNPYLDEYAKENAFQFDRVSFMQRVSHSNRWRQIDCLPKNIKYGHPYPNANVLAIAYKYG